MVDRITIGRRRYREARVEVTIGHGKDLNSTYIYIYIYILRSRGYIYIYVGMNGDIYIGWKFVVIYICIISIYIH